TAYAVAFARRSALEPVSAWSRGTTMSSWRDVTSWRRRSPRSSTSCREGSDAPAERSAGTGMENNRNFFITIALSVLILTLWQVFYMNPRIEAQRAEVEQQQAAQQPVQQPVDGTALAPGAAVPSATVPGAPSQGSAPQAASRDQLTGN